MMGSSGNQRTTEQFQSHPLDYVLNGLKTGMASLMGYTFPGYNRTTGQYNLQGPVQGFPTGGGSFGGGGATGTYGSGQPGQQINPYLAGVLANPMTQGSPALTNLQRTPQGAAALEGSLSPAAFNQLGQTPDIYGGNMNLQQIMAPFMQALGPYNAILGGQSSLMPGAFAPANVPGVSPAAQQQGIAPIVQPGTLGGA